MAYDEELGARVRHLLVGRHEVSKKAMFGGVAYFVGGNMAFGIHKYDLALRVGKEHVEDLLDQDFVKQMVFGTKTMGGYVLVEPEAFENDEDLERWMEVGIDYAKTLPVK